MCTDMVREWKLLFGTFVHTNIYATRGGHRGFRWHTDKTDAFVVQITGEKQWQVCGFVAPHLLADDFGEMVEDDIKQLVAGGRPHLLEARIYPLWYFLLVIAT